MSRNHHSLFNSSRSGYTLVEILVSVTLMLMLMLAVTRLFQYVGSTVTLGQNELLISKKIRGVQILLENDLKCVTVPMSPPRRAADNEGYFCYIEGRGGYYGNMGWTIDKIAYSPDSSYDNTVSDTDDILMFTARAKSDSEKFRGLVNRNMRESHEAEICWFVRGTTLYRRVLLIVPDKDLDSNRNPVGFYKDNDVSVHLDSADNIRANTLADLTRRENRYGHWSNNPNIAFPFPYSLYNDPAWYWLRLPTMADCTSGSGNSANCYYWQAGKQIYSNGVLTSLFNVNNGTRTDLPLNCSALPDGNGSFIDFWENPTPWTQDNGNFSLVQKTGTLVDDQISNPGEGLNIPTLASDSTYGTYVNNLYFAPPVTNFSNQNPRFEDVVLTNVIGFNVQAWDPELNRYTDLWDDALYKQSSYYNFAAYYFKPLSTNLSIGIGATKTLTGPGAYGDIRVNPYNSNETFFHMPGVYETWTDAYELESGTAVNGIYNDTSEDYMKHVSEWAYPPPYNVPLRGIQVKIRVMDPNTKLLKEVTVKADFNVR
ncbi:MAG: prepilin-type N-terminal cleavage/methylation domain-containing protein [Planctomycetaceae bacterium]|jgi:type II secretory pathway component PulJ|nr:prepilin-type N-terminal cleavage/methylation domain-containing protein [Planctomycetaceae bacterium]